jgi:transposase
MQSVHLVANAVARAPTAKRYIMRIIDGSPTAAEIVTAYRAIAELRRDGLAELNRENDSWILWVSAKRHRGRTALRTQAVCRLHAVPAVLRPDGVRHRRSAKQASRMLQGIRGLETVGEQRRQIAKTHLMDIRRLDRGLDTIKARIRRSVAAPDTSVTDIYGVGPVVAAFLVGYTPPIERFVTPDRYRADNGNARIEVSSGGKVRHRLSRRGNRTLNHAIHTASATRIRHDTPGRVYYDKKLGEGTTNKEALQALTRRISNAVYRRLVAGAQRRSNWTMSRPGTDTQKRH